VTLQRIKPGVDGIGEPFVDGLGRGQPVDPGAQPRHVRALPLRAHDPLPQISAHRRDLRLVQWVTVKKSRDSGSQSPIRCVRPKVRSLHGCINARSARKETRFGRRMATI
jgi:hypothetical protein